MTLNLYRALSLLLQYPGPELIGALTDFEARVLQSDAIDASERDVVLAQIARLKSTDLTALQAEYVQTFDLTAQHSLHLTHHLFGDDKNRGPALIDLTEMYKEYGLELDANELPDYLPLVLEFAAQLDDSEARVFLSDAAKVTKQLADNLEQAGSPYAACIRLIESRGGLLALAA
jgi:nitrate reductase delta subunit